MFSILSFSVVTLRNVVLSINFIIGLLTHHQFISAEFCKDIPYNLDSFPGDEAGEEDESSEIRGIIVEEDGVARTLATKAIRRNSSGKENLH